VPPPLRARPRRDPSRPTLTQFLVLSVALHAFFILLFGSPVGGSREGRAMWGGLQVVIRGPLMEPGIGLRLDRNPALTLPGTQDVDARERREAPPPPPTRALPQPAPNLESTHVVDVPVPDRVPAVVPTPPTPKLAPTPRIETPRVEVPVVPVPSYEGTARPNLEPSLAPPVEVARPVRRRVAPVLPTAPAFEGAAPVAAPRLEQPVEVMPVPVPVAPVASQPTPVAVPSLPVPAPVLAAPTLEETPLAAPATAPVLAQPVEVKPIVRPAYTPPVAAPAAPPARATARPEAGPSRETAAPRADSPIFNNNRRAPPAGAPAPGTGPRIDLEAARAKAREMAREGTGNRALLPFAMPAPERRTKLEDALDKARKPDCKDAYKDLGLLAVVPLIANEFGEGTCRW
jgi:hypothetical protein